MNTNIHSVKYFCDEMYMRLHRLHRFKDFILFFITFNEKNNGGVS